MYENCRNKDCNAPLLPTKIPRDAPRQCSKCRSDSYVVRLKNIQKECLEKQVIVPEEMDWGNQNVISNDDTLYRQPKW